MIVEMQCLGKAQYTFRGEGMRRCTCSIKHAGGAILHGQRLKALQSVDQRCFKRRLPKARASNAANPQQKMEQIQEESSEKLEDALDNVEDNLDANVAESLKGLVGEHTFDDEQKETFRYLVSQMRQCASGLAVLAGIVVLSVIQQVAKGESHPVPGISLRGVAVSRVAHAVNAVLVAALMWAGAVSFKKVIKEESNQLAYAIQGIIQLSIIFMQIAPITISFAVVNIVEAAVRWPQSATLVAAGVALTTILRATSLAVLLSKYVPGQKGAAKAMLTLRKGWKGLADVPLIPDRLALMFSAGLLLPYSTPEVAASMSKADSPQEAAEGGPDAKKEDGQEASEKTDSEKKQEAEQEEDDEEQEDEKSGKEQKEDDKQAQDEEPEYEFTRWEERTLEVVMDAMRMSALALALQALSSVMLGVAVGVESSLWSARTYFTNDLVDQSIRAALLFASAGCFRRIPETQGKDITHLLEGLGKKNGLGKLFNRMQKLAWGMAAFRTLGLIMPYITATAVWQKAQHFVASMISKYLPYGGKLVSYAGL